MMKCGRRIPAAVTDLRNMTERAVVTGRRDVRERAGVTGRRVPEGQAVESERRGVKERGVSMGLPDVGRWGHRVLSVSSSMPWNLTLIKMESSTNRNS